MWLAPHLRRRERRLRSPACTADADCSGQLCDEATGACVQCVADADCTGPFTTCYGNFCGCTDDTECGAAGEAPSACNTDIGICGCAADTECAGSPGGEVCGNDGFCGCNAAADCTGDTGFDGASYVCE